MQWSDGDGATSNLVWRTRSTKTFFSTSYATFACEQPPLISCGWERTSATLGTNWQTSKLTLGCNQRKRYGSSLPFPLPSTPLQPRRFLSCMQLLGHRQ
eukprot:1657467-Rhodomonas_salina.1